MEVLKYKALIIYTFDKPKQIFKRLIIKLINFK